MFRKVMFGTFALALAAGPAFADTLRQALVSTYATNPTIMEQREALRETDTDVAIARGAGRPQVSGTVGLNRDLSRSGVFDTGGDSPDFSAGVDLSYPLFNGGSVRNNVRAAETRVEAGRASLRAVEGDVFTEAVAAYMDVIRDRAIVELSANNVRVLETNLDATRQMFKFGDLTRTDIAQSEGRLQLGRANLETTQARLTASEENYIRVIGRRPDALAPPPPLPPLPPRSDEAVRIALANNPNLIAISRQRSAAEFDVRVARAGRLPSVSGVVGGNYVDSLGGNERGLRGIGSQTNAGLNARIPLYQGGVPAARIRAAQAIEGQLLERTVATERSVVSATRSAFANYRAAQNSIASNQFAVTANEVALEGARAERSVGTRTVLDVLNAEQELLNSQVALVTARRNAYVAGFQLLNAMGQAEADDLGLDGGPLYDPLSNYRRVAGNWSDRAGEPRHVRVATRTVAVERTAARESSRLATGRIMSSEQSQNGVAPSVEVATGRSVSQAAAEPPMTRSAGSTTSKTLDKAIARIDGRGWRLQLGTFSTKAAAEALYQELSADGLMAGRQAAYVAFGNLTRLQIGHYARRSEATTACRELVGRGQPCFPTAAK